MFEGAAERYGRFARYFRLQDAVRDGVNRMLREEAGKFRVEDGPRRILSLVVATVLGKALKTFHAVNRLCALGFGEDAAVLLRSNVNLLINLVYIIRDEAPAVRAQEFAAAAWAHHVTTMRMGFQTAVNDADAPLPAAEIPALARAWNRHTIEERARRLPHQHHYNIGYRFYSGIEHSDPLALAGYLTWKEAGPHIDSGPTDSHIGPVLMHNADVMANVLDYTCQHWGIERPDIFAEMKAAFGTFSESGTS